MSAMGRLFETHFRAIPKPDIGARHRIGRFGLILLKNYS